MFSHLPMIFIDFRKLLNEIPHFIHDCLREQELHIRSKARHPRIERLADLDGNGNCEIIFSIWNQHRVLAELLQNHICQVVGTAEFDSRFRAGEHIEYLGLMGVQIDMPERLPALSWLWINCDMLHSIYAEVAEFFSIVGIQIIISIVPEHSKWADDIRLAIVGIPFLLALVIVEIPETDFPVCLNCLVEVVCVLDHAVIHTADTACNERTAVQASAGVAVGQAQDLCCNPVGDVLRDEFGGLDAVNNQPQLIRLKSVCFHPVATRAVVIGNLYAIHRIQNVLIAVEGLDFNFIAVVAVVGENVRHGHSMPLTGVVEQVVV